MPQCGLRQPHKFAIHLESVLDHSLLLAATTSLKIIVSGMPRFLFCRKCACSFYLETMQLDASVIALFRQNFAEFLSSWKLCFDMVLLRIC